MANEIKGLVNVDGTEFPDARAMPLLIPSTGTLSISGDVNVTGTIVGAISGSGYSGGDLTVTGNITIEQGVYTSIANISGNYTTTPTDNNIFCDGNFALTLHDASTGFDVSSSTGQEMMFNNIGTETVNISGTIQGDANPDLLPSEIFNIISNGSGWYWKS